ncbi:MAG: dTDP-4-dehydrorhamnose reductase [Betaproteobacteria bacterium]
MTRLLVTGMNGQVGWELQRSLQCLGDVIAVDRAQFDLAQPDTLTARLEELAPDVVVNAAAYTAVDKAESEEELATRVNGESPGVMAAWAARRGALMLHYSTDYVFDGAGTVPWLPTDTPAPLSAYGRSKLAGETAVIAATGDYLILRTSWVFASRCRNFMLTMLRLAEEREELRVVDDQWGAPTSARLIADVTAQAIARAISERRAGAFRSEVAHLAASGATTWHAFATAILDAAKQAGRPVKTKSLVAIPSSAYPTPARRPSNSRLDCRGLERRFGLALPGWERGLRLCIEERE